MAKQKTGFYRSHDRMATAYTGEIFDPKTGEFVKPPSRTKQSFVAECDINNILKQYKASGQLRHISAKAAQGAYQDLPDEVDFQASLNVVMQGQTAFASLTSKLRNRFHNDPAEFLEFMADPANQEEAIRLGLATDNRPPAPPEGPEISPPGPTGGDGGKPPSEGAQAP